MINIFCGFILDLLFGDPSWFPHPVRIIGKFIEITEKYLGKKYAGKEKFAGILLLLTVVISVYFSTCLIVYISSLFGHTVEFIVTTFLIYTMFATKSLDIEVRKVYNCLARKDIEGARKALSFIVSRETSSLTEKEITRASVETVSENIVDGIISPMFFIFLGGPALGMAYKAVNTLDSMVGYKNEKYINFGWASARFDDLANYIPARITGFILIPFASLISGKDFMRSLITAIRDGRNHNSPNSGYPESAVAGALRIQLGGINTYFGKEVYKPLIGDDINPLKEQNIIDSIRLMYISAVFCLVFFALIVSIIYR